MLSKVAERMYWFARYLERVENTARLVGVYDNLLFDLPRSINISWYNLIVINSATSFFDDRYKVQDERNVVKFLLADKNNPSALLPSLAQARENVRTTRDVFPEDVWELVNELHLYASDNIQSGINRTNRHAYLENIIRGCQQINGLLTHNMSKDAAWHFIRLGRNLERADMTSRILDAGSVAMLFSSEEHKLDASQVIWGNVLRSCSASMNYRRTVRADVTGPDVADFLINDTLFPRSIAYCVEQIDVSLKGLPGKTAEVSPKTLQSMLNAKFESEDDVGETFHEYLNDLQLALADLNGQFNQRWFALT